MRTFLEFHLIQNFAPSNLNRDDTGAPKDAMFGGYRRARISSQCLKRSIRNSPEMRTIPLECNSVRTKNLVNLLEHKLSELGFSDARKKIEAALSSVKLKINTEKWKTETLLFLGHREIDQLAEIIARFWDKLEDLPEKKATKGEKISNKDAKKNAKAKAPDGLGKEIKKILNGQKAVDVALYGRMLADLPSANQDAACQVAHAISTHTVEREFDYFTAIDDQPGDEDSGAGMIDQTEFNSATFYRYAVLDFSQLLSNLSTDENLALESVRAFLKSLIKAIPTGKQNAFAAHNLPSFIGIAIRHGSPLNLANAFEKPIRPKKDKSLTEQSIEALAKYDNSLASVYGNADDRWAIIDLSGFWPKDKGNSLHNIDTLADWVISELRAKLEA